MRVQAGLQTEVIHAGVSGWGTDQQLLWLWEIGVQYHPDLILLAVYPGNVQTHTFISYRHLFVNPI